MATLYDENGNAVEAFTQDELKTKQDEAVAEHLRNNPDKSADVEKIKAELEEANKKLKEAEDGGMNEGQKERLKKAKEDAEGKLSETVGNLTKEISEIKANFTSGIKDKVMNAISKGDASMKEKIDLRYASLMKTGDYKNDEAGITQALTEAATLVTGSKPVPGFLDNMSGAGDRGLVQNNNGGTPVESENAKAMRTAFGIKDADVAKVQDRIITQ